ncbi:hypothetical protein [Halopelagius longus]|uniref:Uncharacterized protein n=1 Tax=Halopelagius longus TaxID=1236180 RepID=A0A1H1GFK3_9EURY|nr:hypothetical protein [Halopelagius longus]RDI69621.1 hypothetical protein DWB78_17770 [Halopelagius longus]SDR11957.1 hypothetical protein SAMN05216278_3639 [Halopelagius longus]
MGCEQNKGNREGEMNDESGVEYSLLDTESMMGTPTLGTFAGNDATTDEFVEANDGSRTLTIQPIGDGVATFEVTTSERIEALSPAHDVTVSAGRSAEDAIVESVRHYRVQGDVTHIRVNGPAEAYLDGQRLE